MQNNNITVYVVTHKKYTKPKDEIYKTIQVGELSDVEINVLRDSSGDNIAYKNGDYCELTAFYWIWKNDRISDVIGICHYRRFFSG